MLTADSWHPENLVSGQRYKVTFTVKGVPQSIKGTFIKIHLEHGALWVAMDTNRWGTYFIDIPAIHKVERCK